MITFYVMLRVLVILSSSFAQPGIVYFHPEVNNEPKNCPVKDPDVILICKTNGTVSRMIIKRARDQKLLYTSPRASTSAEFLIKDVQCVDMGVYQCIIDNRYTETTAVVLPECPPLPCHQEGTTMSVYADVNTTLDISLCVLVCSGILNYIRINTVYVRRKASVYYEWTWDYYENKETSACFRNLTIIALKHGNWTTEGYEAMSFRVYSWAGDPFYLDYNISVIPPASPLEIEEDETKGNNKVLDEKETQEDKEALEDTEALEKSVIIMSPFLIIISGAIVMIVVMIIRKGSRHIVEEHVIEEHVLEELPEAQAPENPQYEEITHFRSDMPDKPVHYVNLKTNAHVEERQYEIPLPAC